MDYTIFSGKKRIRFSTELVCCMYKSENRRCCIDISRTNDEGIPVTLCKYWFESDWLHVMLFDRDQLIINIYAEDAMDEIRAKLTDIGIEES